MKTKAIVFSNEKEAVLFFDEIYPLGIMNYYYNDKNTAQIIAENFLPRELISGVEELNKFLKLNFNNQILSNDIHFSKEGLLALAMLNEFLNNNPSVVFIDNDYPNINAKIELSLYFNEWIKSFNDYAIVGGDLSSKNGSDICFSLENLQLIDTSTVSWEQILEVKKDEKLSKKFRNFRLFFENEIRIKKWDKNEARETFLKLQDDYESAIKSMRFNTITGTVHTIISKESLICSLVGNFLGGNITGEIIGSLIGTSIPLIGNIVLNTIKTSYNNKKLLDQEPIAYIYEAKKYFNIL
jgi:hypothetical protein